MPDYRSAKDAIRSLLPPSLQTAQLIWRRTPLWQKAGVVFIHIPKNGGTSINQSLYGQFMGHFTAAEVSRWSRNTFSTLPLLAVTRNPWDRLLSAYRFARAGTAVDKVDQVAMHRPELYCIPQFSSFERFVHSWLPQQDLLSCDHVFKPQHHYVLDHDDQEMVTFIGRIEELGQVSQYLEDTLRKKIRIGHINRTNNNSDYQKHYTPEMRDIVARIYEKDIKRFKYDF